MQFYKLATKTNLYLIGSCWGTLGFHRGMKQYDYDHKYHNVLKKNYVYTDQIFLGLFGTFVYINPCFLPLMLHKEMYRLEVNLRGLEDEKSMDNYNKLL